MLFGLGAITYARHPEGVLEFQKGKSLATVQKWLPERLRGPVPDPSLAPTGSADG